MTGEIDFGVNDRQLWFLWRLGERTEGELKEALKNAGQLFRRLHGEMDESGIHTYPPGPWHARAGALPGSALGGAGKRGGERRGGGVQAVVALDRASQGGELLMIERQRLPPEARRSRRSTARPAERVACGRVVGRPGCRAYASGGADPRRPCGRRGPAADGRSLERGQPLGTHQVGGREARAAIGFGRRASIAQVAAGAAGSHERDCLARARTPPPADRQSCIGRRSPASSRVSSTARPTIAHFSSESRSAPAAPRLSAAAGRTAARAAGSRREGCAGDRRADRTRHEPCRCHSPRTSTTACGRRSAH